MYALIHNGTVYGPNGPITDVDGVPLDAKDAEAYNKAIEEQELAWLKTGPDKIMAYVKRNESQAQRLGQVDVRWAIITWRGIELDGNAWIGYKSRVGFQGDFGSFRRPVTARIFGVLYHGWYYESSGDYCRLKRAKRQQA